MKKLKKDVRVSRNLRLLSEFSAKTRRITL